MNRRLFAYCATGPKSFRFGSRQGALDKNAGGIYLGVRKLSFAQKWPKCLQVLNQVFVGGKTKSKTQPMIPAHDCSGLHVFAGTWQSPANL